MSDQHSSVADRLTAAGTMLSVVLSALAVAVTMHIAYVQNKASEQQNQFAHALGYVDIYFGDTVITARDTVDRIYLDASEQLKASKDANADVAKLLKTSQEQLSFDRLISLYDQIAACANTKVCSGPVTTQLYGRDMQKLFQNWYGYILARRAQLRETAYGCQLAIFLDRDFLAPDKGCTK
jgi:hypothetical protein